VSKPRSQIEFPCPACGKCLPLPTLLTHVEQGRCRQRLNKLRSRLFKRIGKRSATKLLEAEIHEVLAKGGAV
jgi:hypothetical protein